MGRIYINPWIKDVPGLKLAFWIVLWSSVDVVLSNIKGDVCNEPHSCICTQARCPLFFYRTTLKMFFCHFQVKMRRKKEKGRDHNPNHHFYLRHKEESVFLARNICLKILPGGYVNTEYSGVGQNWLSFIGFNPLEIYLYRLSLQWKGIEWNGKTFNSNFPLYNFIQTLFLMLNQCYSASSLAASQ